MQKYDIHVCLVSDQAAANLLPAAMPEFQPKEAIFFVTEDMEKSGRAEQLKKAFQTLGIDVYEKMLTNPFDFEVTEYEIQLALECHKGMSFSDLDIALNVTGGNKVMAMAAQHIFNVNNKPIFYVNTKKNDVMFLSSDRKNNFEMKAKLSLNTYLLSYGFNVHSFNTEYDNCITPALMDFFIIDYDKNHELISEVNRYSSQSNSNSYIFNDNDEINYRLANLFSTLNKDEVIKYDNQSIDFITEETRRLLGGVWFENYVYQLIKDIIQIDDIAMNLSITTQNFNNHKRDLALENLGKQNEFDVAFIAKNKLHIIECKTAILNGNEKDEQILYKLKALTDKMGSMVKVCLISYLPVPTAIKHRAENDNIKIIDSLDIQSIKSNIRQWVEE